jgi:DNA-binding transcriptional regulator YiaG
LVTGDDLKRGELAAASALAQAGIATPASFRYLRKAAGLRAADLAQLLDVSPETVSRWETGRSAIERRAFVLVALMVEERRRGDESLVERFCRAAGAPQPLPTGIPLLPAKRSRSGSRRASARR